MTHMVNTMGLHVCFDSADEAQIDRALKQLDPSLFLDKERDKQTGGIYWIVKHYLGPDLQPVVIEWRHPLSTGLIYAVEQRKEHFGKNLAAEAADDNERLQARQREELEAEHEETLARFRKTTLHLIPRSTTLARTRARMRREGKG